MFIDLVKAFDTFDHKILLRKRKIYGIGRTKLRWFDKQNKKKTDLKDVVCRVPQRSILDPLFFLIYVTTYNMLQIY